MFALRVCRPRLAIIGRSFSSYKMVPAMQELHADVAIAWRETHRDTSDFTCVPGSFFVPNEAPYPENARGRQLNYSYFRMTYRKNLLAPEIVETLNSINFVWNLREHNWKMILQALTAFRKLHGDLLVPANYIVPQSEDYPKDTWGMKLGYTVDNLRRRPNLTESQQAELKQVGFIWDHFEFNWLKKVAAFAHYKKLHGHLEIPKGYRVPQDDSWPAEFHGMPLRQAIEYLRFRKHELSDKVKAAADAIDFIWDPWQLSWENKIAALEAYVNKYGHPRVPQKFVVPLSDEWPQSAWGLKLGECMAYIRGETRPDRVAQLEALGVKLTKPRLPKELRKALANSA